MQASNRPKEAGMNRYAVWMMLVMAMACTPEENGGGASETALFNRRAARRALLA